MLIFSGLSLPFLSIVSICLATNDGSVNSPEQPAIANESNHLFFDLGVWKLMLPRDQLFLISRESSVVCARKLERKISHYKFERARENYKAVHTGKKSTGVDPGVPDT